MSAATELVAPAELTIYQVAALRGEWVAGWRRGMHRLDLSAVTEIDGAGTQLVIAWWRMAARDGVAAALHAPSPAVRDAFALLGAAHLLPPATATGATHA